MGKIALIFSGQGAQYSGMGKALYDASPAAKAVFDLADSIRGGTSAQCFEGAAEELNRTVRTLQFEIDRYTADWEEAATELETIATA